MTLVEKSDDSIKKINSKRKEAYRKIRDKCQLVQDKIDEVRIESDEIILLKKQTDSLLTEALARQKAIKKRDNILNE